MRLGAISGRLAEHVTIKVRRRREPISEMHRIRQGIPSRWVIKSSTHSRQDYTWGCDRFRRTILWSCKICAASSTGSIFDSYVAVVMFRISISSSSWG